MNKKQKLKRILAHDLLGKIPLFYSKLELKDADTAGKPINHVRHIEVAAYRTSSFQSRGYHKPISKIQ